LFFAVSPLCLVVVEAIELHLLSMVMLKCKQAKII
jgi:hypothetical protein